MAAAGFADRRPAGRAVGNNVAAGGEIEATFPNGASDRIVRVVTENSRTLKLDSLDFETE